MFHLASNMNIKDKTFGTGMDTKWTFYNNIFFFESKLVNPLLIKPPEICFFESPENQCYVRSDLKINEEEI